MTHTQKQEGWDGWHLGLVDPYRRTRISVVVNGPPEISRLHDSSWDATKTTKILLRMRAQNVRSKTGV